MNPQNSAVGRNGFIMITGTAAVECMIEAFSPNTDAVVTSLKDKDGNVVTSQYNCSGVTLSQGGYFPCNKAAHGYFSEVTLSSGDLTGYNK